MFEEFRRQTDDSAFMDDVMHEGRHFLGMTPAQRFIVALVLMMMAIILGALLLLDTYKIVPPFLG